MCCCLLKSALIPAVFFRIAKFDLGNKNKSICEPGPAIFVTKLLFLLRSLVAYSAFFLWKLYWNAVQWKQWVIPFTIGTPPIEGSLHNPLRI
jgi:hypothetical protein